MALLELLVSLGFTNSSLIGEKKEIATIKARTSRGWTYERFRTEGDVRDWARGKEPG